MARAAHEIVVNAPLSAVYDQWTQFEELPRFMDAVTEVRQLDDSHLWWKANIAGSDVEWQAEIREQVPNDKIVWHATEGANNAGLVSFRAIGADQTEVHLEMSYEPDGVVQSVGDALGLVSSQVKGDLEHFKEFIEDRNGRATGAWRGEIANPDVPGGHTHGEGTRS